MSLPVSTRVSPPPKKSGATAAVFMLSMVMPVDSSLKCSRTGRLLAVRSLTVMVAISRAEAGAVSSLRLSVYGGSSVGVTVTG